MIGLLLLAHSGSSVWGMEPIATKLLAAMPILESSMTQIIAGAASDEFHLSVSRAILPRVVVRAEASTTGPFDLNVRFLAPLQVAPAFLAVEVGPKRVTGLMTLFFGSVSIDLGRTWFEPSRWAFVQLIVHPRLTMVVGGIQQSEAVVPLVGWRLFPAASAQWEIDMLFSGSEIRLSVGGIL
jgi:hypothetical protein